MEFVVGNFYKTRGGSKVEFVGKSQYYKDEPLLFMTEYGYVIQARENGGHLYESLGEQPFDIIAEWTE